MWSTGVHWRVNTYHTLCTEKNPQGIVPWSELDPFLNRYVTCLRAKKRLDIKNFRAWPCHGICSCKILDLQPLMSGKPKFLSIQQDQLLNKSGVMWVKQISPSWAKKERKHLLQASVALWDIYSLFLYAPTLILWTRSLNLKNPEPLFPVWLLHNMLLPLRLLSRVAFLITHLLGLCQPFRGFTFNYSSMPLSGHQGNVSNNQGGRAAVEDVSSQTPQHEGKKTHRNSSESHVQSKSDHFRRIHSHLPSSLPLEHNTL